MKGEGAERLKAKAHGIHAVSFILRNASPFRGHCGAVEGFCCCCGRLQCGGRREGREEGGAEEERPYPAALPSRTSSGATLLVCVCVCVCVCVYCEGWRGELGACVRIGRIINDMNVGRLREERWRERGLKKERERERERTSVRLNVCVCVYVCECLCGWVCACVCVCLWLRDQYGRDSGGRNAAVPTEASCVNPFSLPSFFSLTCICLHPKQGKSD